MLDVQHSSSTLLFPFEPRPGLRRFGPSLVEMIQLERVVDALCDAEAAASPWAAAELHAVAEHARAVEPYLRDIAAGRGVDAAALRDAAPQLFERDVAVLLQHGLDLADEVKRAADEEGDAGLQAFCAAWLACRRPLVDNVVAALKKT